MEVHQVDIVPQGRAQVLYRFAKRKLVNLVAAVLVGVKLQHVTTLVKAPALELRMDHREMDRVWLPFDFHLVEDRGYVRVTYHLLNTLAGVCRSVFGQSKFLATKGKFWFPINNIELQTVECSCIF